MSSVVVEPSPLAVSNGQMRAGLRLGIYAVLVFGPLAFGATEPWSALAIQTAAAAIFVSWCLSKESIFAGEPIFSIGALFCFGAVVAIQVLVGISAYGEATKAEFLNYVAYGMVFVVAADIFRDDGALVRLTDLVIFFGFLLAVFAIVQDLSGTDRLYWLRTPTLRVRFFGPYVNRNHYAGLMEMLFPFVMTASLYRRFHPAKRSLAAFASVIITASVVLSRSRTGAVIIVLEAVVLAVARIDRRRLGPAIVIAIAAAAALIGFVYWVGAEGAVQHFRIALTGTDQSGLMRLQIVADSVKLIAQRPVFGWGAGTFPYIYSAFRSFQTDLWVNEAHNDLLQVFVETGVVGFGCILAFLGDVFRRGIGRSRGVYNPGAPVVTAALVGLGGLLLHSFVDFNLHIPANAVWFFFLCGVAGTGAVGPRVVASRRRVVRTLDEHGTLQPMQ